MYKSTMFEAPVGFYCARLVLHENKIEVEIEVVIEIEVMTKTKTKTKTRTKTYIGKSIGSQ